MTIAQQLKVKEFPFVIKDSRGNEIYYEDSTGCWLKSEYDLNGKEIYYENSRGYWSKKEYDSNNNQIYFGNSTGYWSKKEYDSNSNEIYYEDSDGTIIDNRPKQSVELTLDDIAAKFNINVNLLKIKK